MSIQEHLNKIRNAVYGREVRESIVKGIETAYDDASEKDNANMEVKIARGTHPNLRSRLEEVDNKQQQTTAQLAHIENEGTLCSSLGLIPNDETKAVENLIMLTDALIEGKKILVDDIYYINQINERRFIQNTVFSLKGVTPNAEFKTTIKSAYALFNLSGNSKVFVEDITFTGISDVPVPLFSTDTLSYFDKIYIEKCTFNGLLAGSFLTSTEIDPLTQQVGIGEVVFRENSANDIKASFLNLNNTPVKKVVINDNVINNFCRMFINGTLANESPNLKELEKARPYMEVKNNHVTCDDDWFDETSTWSYHCFVLWESDGKVLYDNNHVEGLKSRKDVPVYDVYLSANEVSHTNSVWKNNLCFHPSKNPINASLMKSKRAGENGTRLYEGNTYIVEKEFVERIGENLENAWVYFMDLISPIENYVIKNNKFYVYELRFRANTANVGFNITNFSIENNDFKAYRGGGVLMNVDYFEDFDYSNGTHKISNNNFLIEETPNFRLLQQGFRGDSRPKNKSIIIDNNHFQGETLNLHSRVSTEKLVITNNNIWLTADDVVFTSSDLLVDEVLSENNNIKTSGLLITRFGEFGLKVQRNDKFTAGRLGIRTGMFFLEGRSVKNHKYIVEMKLLFPEGWQKMSYEFVYGYDDILEQNYLEFKDANDEVVRKLIGEAGNVSIKVNNETELVYAKPTYTSYWAGTTVFVTSPVHPIMYEEKVNSFEI